ncbi:hypothetical protein FGIG_09170 [Fasciola gigantica]|uniref:Uncharacterized protein n=1 Tax=Fasciola gigantica TaxID=46835 RepID=A0A504YMQ5_FASGI|nr:hypothetical protein FGIG_09170 [Fasciola gigantica]
MGLDILSACLPSHTNTHVDAHAHTRMGLQVDRPTGRLQIDREIQTTNPYEDGLSSLRSRRTLIGTSGQAGVTLRPLDSYDLYKPRTSSAGLVFDKRRVCMLLRCRAVGRASV